MNRFGKIVRTLAFCVVIGATLINAGPALQAASIQEQLKAHMPVIVRYLNDRNLKTVGVLKFRVRKPGQKTSDSVGPLNSLLADRLEVGLILANPFDEEKQLNIIKDASAQASGIEGANHISAAGRAAFFGPTFRLAWGKEKLAADAFLTGIVQVHEDGRIATIGILCFDRSGGKLERVGQPFEATLDAAALSEMGESFVLRGAFDDGATELSVSARQEQVLKSVAKVKQQLTSFPTDDAASAVDLEVFYDGKLADIELRDGQAFIEEPTEGQKVEIVLARGATARGTIGVVVKVNGENTLYRQTQRDLDCAKWLLTPDHQRTVISGYQMPDSNVIEKFTVLSERESEARAIDYGRSVGQIQVTTFRERRNSDAPAEVIDENDEDLLALLRGVQPDEPPLNPDALKAQLRAAGREGTTRGGLIVAGEQAVNEIEIVEFQPDPIPVQSVTLVYYTPNKSVQK